MPITAGCTLARKRLTDFNNGLAKSSLRDRITTGIKAGYVGSIVTPLRAVAGNASMVPLVHLAKSPIATAVDVVISHGKAAATGYKLKPHEFRTLANGLDADGLGVMARGFGRGTEPIRGAFRDVKAGLRTKRFNPDETTTDRGAVASFVDELRLRLAANPSVPNSTVEWKRTVYDSPLAQTATDATFAALEGVDRPFWSMAFDTSIYRQSKVYAIREGLTGKALKQRAAELMEKPTDEMVFNANDAANYATFKDRNVLSNLAGDAKRAIKSRAEKKINPDLPEWERKSAEAKKFGAGAADYLAETNVPFIGVPSSVVGKMVSFSPFGMLDPAIYRGGQLKQAEALATAGIGYGMVAVGMQLYDKGLLTFSEPASQSEKEQFRLAGKKPFSVFVNGHWIGLKSLGPAASSFFMGGALRRGLDEVGAEFGANQETAVGLAKGTGESIKFFTQQTYIQRIGDLIEMAQAGQGALDKAGRLAVAVALPTPAFLGQASRAADPYNRDNRGLGNQIKAKLPFGHLYAPTPKAVGPTGELPRKTPVERISSVVSPFPVSKDRDNDVLRELRRLGVSFGLPSKQVRGGGRSADIPRSQWVEFTTQAGNAAMADITATLANPDFQGLDDDEKKEVLDKLVTGARSEYREMIKEALLAGAVPRRKKITH